MDQSLVCPIPVFFATFPYLHSRLTSDALKPKHFRIITARNVPAISRRVQIELPPI
jgi:hypothetical protein